MVERRMCSASVRFRNGAGGTDHGIGPAAGVGEQAVRDAIAAGTTAAEAMGCAATGLRRSAGCRAGQGIWTEVLFDEGDIEQHARPDRITPRAPRVRRRHQEMHD
ncbi:hypothetical protein CRH09_21800 [Nocardia terpenica]|uniref:Uncharacterized protein n=1 Tax=Nocardia terpenica TaxID=455432 RepID=A0A291RMN0_9NOCA|nr:hypothetical protein CRH09_21800 [Nocardia terpenica]